MKKLLSLAVSLGLLALIYWKIDFTKLGPVFANCDGWWLAASLAMVIPLTALTAWRFQQLAPGDARISFGEATRLILSASVLNLILPSKMGDIAKAFFLPMRRSLALSLVVFEKACRAHQPFLAAREERCAGPPERALISIRSARGHQ